MTPSDEQQVISALHEMEVRFTERLTRIETEASAWRKTHDDLRLDIQRVATDAKEAAQAVAVTQAADKDALIRENRRIEDQCTKGQQKLTIGLIIVGAAAAGRLAANLYQLFTPGG